MNRLATILIFVTLAGCATTSDAPSTLIATPDECSKAYFDSLRIKIADAKRALNAADAVAHRNPTEANNAKAAEAAADAAMAAADLDAARADCSGS